MTSFSSIFEEIHKQYISVRKMKQLKWESIYAPVSLHTKFMALHKFYYQIISVMYRSFKK